MDVRVLGPLRVLADGRELPLGGRKARIVFAMLVVHRRRVVSAGALAEAVWSAESPATFATSLQVSVSNLRKMLRDAGIESADVLRTVQPGYVLDLAESDCDVGRFEQARSAGSLAATPADAAVHYRRALAEWQGDVLADLRGLSFADTFAAALDEERWHTLAARIEADIASGRAARVIGELTTLTNDFPLREPFWVQLATALYLTGRQSDALEACRRVRRILAHELAVDPGPQLLLVEQRILRQETLDLGVVEERRQSRGSTVTEVDVLTAARSGLLHISDGRTVAVSGRINIGRAPDNDIPLNDPKVSRYHARIVQGHRGLVIKDLESTNGVFVEDERLDADAMLYHGIEIRIGSTTMTFEETQPG
ncbi:BTAD domain-containing putative transcriptional regulator [Antrihabitans sp. YC2-6]|uniref:BTAD domain-containing putative transcriptional regulator n=1 Tax=Antrihabitans sp. YC2-6 TaxID=2799498 RepID=UPI0018F6AB29|nr:BTAD domain-containing putative transcriptional regulator [Antrihabitans sp. YC2-6]MBJ8348147.1 FHA domain-containing protein [Antrihabitans sp. YC2-6]